MSKYVKLTNKFRKDLEDMSKYYRKMYNAVNYINSNPYHMLEKRCNCPSCHQAFGHYTLRREMA